jgi:hypothetical protein
MSPDVMNACFELGGAMVLVLNLRRMYLDKTVRGVSWIPTAFFTSWGLFNQWFYGALGALWSLRAGALVCAVNLVWLGMTLHYARQSREKTAKGQ